MKRDLIVSPVMRLRIKPRRFALIILVVKVHQPSLVAQVARFSIR
nr:MAG TPA: hypothetical protein [Caudoviricetes sp.]